ncbi:hypothetical protein D3C83_106600 [compost metagenome]
MHDIGELPDVLARERVVLPRVEGAGIGHDEMRFPSAGLAQDLEDANAVNRAGGTGDRDDQTLGGRR